MSICKKRVITIAALTLLFAKVARTYQPVAACEMVVPANYPYQEQISFDQSRFPLGLSIDLTRPEWVETEGFAGFLQLANQGTADIYLLASYQLEDIVSSLTDGQLLDSALWSHGVVLRQGDTLDIVGEGNLMQFSPGLQPLNVSHPEGGPRPSTADTLPTQSGKLYFVADQQLSIVPFTLVYVENSAYKPEGTFHPYTLSQKVEEAPLVALGTTLQEAGYDSRESTTVQVESWLKGSGGSQITVAGFGGTSCDYQIAAGARHIFFLSPEGDGYRLLDFQAGMFDAITWPDDAAKITAIIGPATTVLPAAVPDAVASPTAVPPAESAPAPILWPWIFGFAVAAVIGYSRRRQRGGRGA